MPFTWSDVSPFGSTRPEAPMKKKGSRDIPDFSHTRTPLRTAAPSAQDPAARRTGPAPSARQPLVKPQATSAKSGRRGQ